MIKIGDKAPELNLYNTDKEKISIEKFRGKTLILFFFPLAFSRVCSEEMCIINDEYNEYQKFDSELIGISVDSIFSLKKFKENNNLNSITFLSDFNRNIIESYGVVSESFPFDYQGVSKRATFIINTQGNISYIEILSESSELPNFTEIKYNLDNLCKI